MNQLVNIVRRRSSGSQAAPVVYPSSELVIRAGGATGNKYLAFGDLGRDPNNGNLYYAFAALTDHTSTTGNIELIKSTDNGETWTDANGNAGLSTVIRLNNGTRITNAGIVCLSTGRKIVYYTELTAGGTYIYSKYSDDDFVTLDSATNVDANIVTADYDVGPGTGYCDASTGAIELDNGDILKPVYGQYSATGYEGAVYKSTDGGLTYSRLSTIYTLAQNMQEPMLLKLNNGNILCAMRDSPGHLQAFCLSEDQGVTWGEVVKPFGSDSKAAIAQAANGTIFFIGRGTAIELGGFELGVGISAYTNDPNGLTGWVVSELDNRLNAFNYGGACYDPVNDKFIAIWSSCAYLKDPYVGPTLLIKKDFVFESGTEPVEYNRRYQNVLDFAQGVGHTLPSDALKTRDNNFFNALESAGLISRIDAIVRAGVGTTAYEDFYRHHMGLEPWRVVTKTNNPTYANDGYQFVPASTQYVSWGIRTDQYTNYKLNNSGILYYTPTNNVGPTGGRNFGNTPTQLIARNGDGNLYFRVHSGTLSSIANSNGSGRWFLQRVDANNQSIFRNGTLFHTAAVASSGPIDSTIPLIGALAGPSGYGDDTFGLLIYCDGMGGTGEVALLDSIVSDYLSAP